MSRADKKDEDADKALCCDSSHPVAHLAVRLSPLLARNNSTSFSTLMKNSTAAISMK